MFFSQGGDDGGEVALAGARDDIGRARTVAPHAHVERPVEPERKSARGFVKLHRRHAEIEHDAVGRGAACDRRQIGEAILDELEPAARFLDESGAPCDGVVIAIDADHARARRLQDRARIAAAAERRVDIEAAVADAEPVDGAAGEHGNVTSQSASDSIAVAARHHSRAPSGFAAAAIRVPSSA